MRIKHVRKRYNTYYYQRRVPKDLITHFQCTSFLKTLNTSDVAVAIKRAALIDEEWEALRKPKRVTDLYDDALSSVDSFPEHISTVLDGLDEDQQHEAFNKLPTEDQVTWRAAPEKLLGRHRLDAYKFRLSDGLEAIRPVKEHLPDKTWAKYQIAVDAFGDRPLETIKKSEVADWLDGLRTARSVSTRKIYVSLLGQIYDHAMTRGHITDTRSNPFRNHHHGRNDLLSYRFMDDGVFIDICNLLDPRDALIAHVGRFHGMRLTEIFESDLTVVEGLPCFDVRNSKTKAGVRIVPIRKHLLNQIETTRDQWGCPKAFSKRFGRAKVKAVGRDRSLCFHSLRATFITLAGQAGIPEQQVAWCVGHEDGKGNTMSGSLYFKGYTLDAMREVVESIPYVKTPSTK